MDRRTVGALAQVCQAEVVGDPFTGVGPDVVADSREATPGCLFVALPGGRTDGHDHAREAVEAGAAALLVAHPVDVDVPQLVVPDPLAALAQLARGVVAGARATGLRTVCVTGSNGKTSTKDLIAAVLATRGRTVAPVNSYNNEVGVPLTALRVDADTRFLVAEMGARKTGHIQMLCRIVPPDIGVVLNVGVAHLSEFGSVEAIAQAKGELVEAVGLDGWAVLNADDERVAAMRARTVGHVATFGVGAEPAFGEIRVWADDPRPDEWQRYSFVLRAGERRADVSLRVTGRHQVANAAAAAAVGLSLGIDLGAIAGALSHAGPRSHWRLETTTNADGVIVVNDAYNANPDSMSAGLDAAAELRRPQGRVVAVLGEMLELGADAARFHEQLGEHAAADGVDALIVVGEHAGDVARGAARGGLDAQIVDGATEAAAAARAFARPGDVVLVKASRDLGFESVAQALLDGEEPAA